MPLSRRVVGLRDPFSHPLVERRSRAPLACVCDDSGSMASLLLPSALHCRPPSTTSSGARRGRARSGRRTTEPPAPAHSPR